MEQGRRRRRARGGLVGLGLALACAAGCSEYELADDDDATAPADDDDTAADDDTTAPSSCELEEIPGGECDVDDGCVAEQPGEFEPVTLWSRHSWTSYPDHTHVMMTPLVVRLSDHDGDGDVDADDPPDVLVVTYYGPEGWVRAVSGVDGAELWTSDLPLQGTSGLAAGDLDGDGMPEIVGVTLDGELRAYEHDGTTRWTSLPLGDRITQYSTNPSISDMDHDGHPEVIAGAAILTHDGALRGAGTVGIGYHTSGHVGASSFAVDADRDGSEEVIVGNAAYGPDGELRYLFGSADGFPAVGDFDGDAEAEVVVVGGNRVALYELDGTTHWSHLIGDGGGGPPTVADFDGDHRPEVGVASIDRYRVYDTDGSLLWERETMDWSSGITGSSVFDFQGDGFAEVVYADEGDLWVFAGSDGSVVLRDSGHYSMTWLEYPVIADVDADGHAELVVAHNEGGGAGYTGVSVIEGVDDDWMPARPIWNQHAYFLTNVEDDGSIPVTAAANWDSFNSFRAGDLVAGDWADAVNLSGWFAAVCELECDANRVVVQLQLCNGGTADVDVDIPLTMYANAGGSLTVADTMLVEGGLPSGTKTGGIEWVLPADALYGATMVLWIDDDGSGEGVVRECDEDDNLVMWSAYVCP